jgi:putative peptidoglycan lipid II flippase
LSSPPARLGRAAAGISGLTAASRVTGFGRVLVVTAVLGTTYLGNTYQAANVVPNLVFELFAAGALHAVLVPTLVGTLDAEGRAAAERLAGGVLGAVLAGLAVVTALGMALSPLVMRLVAAGIDDATVRDAQVELGTVFLLVFLPQLLLYGLGLVATGSLHAEHRFHAPAAAPVANNVVVIGAYALFWWLRRDAGPWPADGLDGVEVAVLAGGTTLGVLALTAVPVLALRRSGFRLRPRWHVRDAKVRRLARHGGWAVLQVAATQGVLLVVLLLANPVPGGVVVFQFALTFFLLPVALVGVPIATAVFPRLSRQDGDGSTAVELLRRSTVTVLALLLPASAALVALAWPIVRVTAFGQAADAGLAPLAHALMAMAPGLSGYALVLLLTRAFYARGDARTPALLVLGGLLVAVVVMVVVAPQVDLADRVTVVALAHSGGYLLAAGLLWWRLDHVLAQPLGIGRIVAGLVAAAAMAGVAMWAVTVALDVEGRVAALLVGALAAAVGLLVDAGAARVAGIRLPGALRLEPAHG